MSETEKHTCSRLQQYLEEVEESLVSSVEDVPSPYRGSLERLLTRGGKRLRPKLVLLSAMLGRPDHTRLIRLAAGVELLHVATLIHDDIIDGARTRRGSLTLHELFPSRQAVIAGDFLLARSFEILHSSISEEHTGDFITGILHICKSELRQNASRFCLSASVREYYRRILGKTSALFMLSCQVGAIEGGLSPEWREMLRRYAYNLGMAFQIQDDILDIRGNPRTLKKPANQDFGQGIYTLPVILAVKTDPAAARILSGCAKKRKSLPAGRLSDILLPSGAVGKALSCAAHYTERGLNVLGSMPDTNETCQLKELLLLLSGRTQ